ncbi:MAG: metallophosphoesterase [Myxococcota bacterium]|nr:metallophosphoesterase [Myxococcota bacterium]
MSPPNIVVISDVHMSNNAHYSWFKSKNKTPEALKHFLTKLSTDTTVQELVLLGDIFDLWLYPVDVSPWDFLSVVHQWPQVIDGLKACVAALPVVTYINGNHDMTVGKGQIETISSGGNHVRWMSAKQYNEDPEHAEWLHLEHGHACDMFNAKPSPKDNIANLPLGYFITRLVATADNKETCRSALKDAIEAFHSDRIAAKFATRQALCDRDDILDELGKALVVLVIDALVDYVNIERPDFSIDDTTDIVMPAGIDTVTVSDVKHTYHSLLKDWLKKEDHNFFHLLDSMLVSVRSEDGLDWYAKHLADSESSLKVIVMGHTHYAKVGKDGYFNDGRWCSAPYDAVVIDTEQRTALLKKE